MIRSNNTVSDSVQKKQKDLWNSIYVMLQDFKYWLVEGSLHELQKPHMDSNGRDSASYHAKKLHRTFKEVQVSDFPCDKCRKRSIMYQCTDCDQGYCTDCWPRTQKRGARLEDGGERLFDSKQQLIQMSNLGPPRSTSSSPDLSPTRTPTEYLPLPVTEAFSFSPNI